MRKLYINKENISQKMLSNNYIREALDKRKKSLSDVIRSTYIEINSYKELVKEVAELSYLNQDYILFYRGQNKNYQPNKLTSLYPSIYRGDRIIREEMEYRINVLDTASSMLKDYLSVSNNHKKLIGVRELLRMSKIQWSILQHYEVCGTPFLDLTHSLRVACSFAQLDCEEDFCYVYVLALPYLTGRISINSEHDLTNIRLISISPPQALRPYFQESYLASTEYVLDNYDHKSELDFNRRLIGIYRIPNTSEFWGKDFGIYDKELLFPKDDEVFEICKDIKRNVNNKIMGDSDISSFLKRWVQLESWIRSLSEDNYSVISGIKYLKHNKKAFNLGIDPELIDDIRLFRNKLVHQPKDVSSDDILIYNNKIYNIINRLK